MKISKKWILKGFLGIFLLIFLFWKIDIGQATIIIKQANAFYLLLLMPIFLFLYLLNALIFKILTSIGGNRIPLLRLWRYSLLSWSLGLFLPSKLGQISLVYFLKKEGIPLGKATAIFFIQMGASLMVTFFFSIGALFIIFPSKQLTPIVSSLFLLVGVSILLLLLLSYQILKNYFRKICQKFVGFLDYLRLFFRKGQVLLAIVFLSIANSLFAALAVQVVFFAFKERISFFPILIFHSIVFLSSLIPISINGLGVKESMAVYLYNYSIGTSQEVVFSVYLFFLIFNYLVAAICVLYFIKFKGINTKNKIKTINNFKEN